MKGPLRIAEVFAFIVVDDDGTEGVPAMLDVSGVIAARPVLLPLMGADLARMGSLRRYVETDPIFLGKRITLCKFTHRETITVIDRTQE